MGRPDRLSYSSKSKGLISDLNSRPTTKDDSSSSSSVTSADSVLCIDADWLPLKVISLAPSYVQ